MGAEVISYEARALQKANYDLIERRMAKHEALSGQKLLNLVWGLLAFTVFGVFGWAALAPLNMGVTSHGVLATQSGRQVLQSLDGGVVKTFYAKEGDHVKAGQVLAELDSGLATTQLQIVRQQYLDHLGEKAMIEADLSGSPIVWPAELKQDNDPVVASVVNGYTRQLGIRRGQRSATKAVIRQQIAGLGDQVTGLKAQATSIESQGQLIGEETLGLRGLYDQGYAPKSRVLALQRSAASLKGNLGETQAQIAQASTLMGEKRVQALQLDAQDRQQASSRLAVVTTETLQIAEKLADQQQVVARADIKSPVNGVVLKRDISTVGGVVRPGEPVFEVVPTDDLIVTSTVKPQDVENLQVGMGARVKLTGLNVQTTPQLVGMVVYVSADSLSDEKSGTSFYQIRVSVPKAERQKLRNIVISPGMPAEVMVDGGKRTMLQYLLRPVTAAFSRAFRDV